MVAQTMSQAADVERDRLIPMRQLAALVGRRPKTLIAYGTKGRRGIRLRTRRVIGRQLCCLAWWEEFVAAYDAAVERERQQLATAAAGAADAVNDRARARQKERDDRRSRELGV